jgi:hypothetical protein
MGKINPILNLSWAMALPAVNSKEAATADTMNARFVIGESPRGKRKGCFWAGCEALYFKL